MSSSTYSSAITVTDHSATVIDNIFTNATDFDTTSGNILNQLADHFSQFMVLKKLNINHEDSAVYKYDHSNFDKNNVVSDFAKINWNENKNTNPGDVNAKFYNFHDKFSICVKKNMFCLLTLVENNFHYEQSLGLL